MFQSCLAQLVLHCLFSAHDSLRQENQDLNLWTPWKAYSPFFLSIYLLFFFFKAISGGSVSARRVTQTDGHAITWLYNPINGPPDLLFMKTMEGNAATARRPLHQKQNITLKKKTSHQRWLQMQIKKSWKPVKLAGALTTPALPVGSMEGLWSRTTSEPTEQQLWHPRHSSPNVALTQSLKKVT